MYIYHKQCEIMQKIQWNSSNAQLHWFLIDFLWKWSIMDQKLCKRKPFFSVAKFFKGYPCMPFESWRPAVSINVVVFYAIFLKPDFLLLKVRSNMKFFWEIGVVQKNKYLFNFEFHTSIFNQGGDNRYVLRLIVW